MNFDQDDMSLSQHRALRVYNPSSVLVAMFEVNQLTLKLDRQSLMPMSNDRNWNKII